MRLTAYPISPLKVTDLSSGEPGAVDVALFLDGKKAGEYVMENERVLDFTGEQNGKGGHLQLSHGFAHL